MVMICPLSPDYKMEESLTDLEKSREEAEILSSKVEGKNLET